MTDLKAASKDATNRLSDAIGFKTRLTWNVPIDWFKDPDINEVIVNLSATFLHNKHDPEASIASGSANIQLNIQLIQFFPKHFQKLVVVNGVSNCKPQILSTPGFAAQIFDQQIMLDEKLLRKFL